MAIWLKKKENKNVELISKTFKISEITSQVIINKKLYEQQKIKNYLNPSMENMYDISLMKDCKEATNLIFENINFNNKITIYGDYDVDGVMSTSILYKGIKVFYDNIDYYIPHRELEGYGLNKDAIKKLKYNGTKLIITCDNGIASIEEVDYAREIGLQIIIIDHHEPYFTTDDEGNKINMIPNANAVIDPKQKDCKYPFKMLCAAGICFKFVQYLFKFKNEKFTIIDELIVLAMVATFCDVVDLFEENRIIAKNGLEILNKNKNVNMGLYHLIQEKNILDKNIDNFIIGFVIGPCINATGRLEEATLAVKMFITDMELEASELAIRLCDLNEKRKHLTQKSIETVLDNMKINNELNNKIIVIYDLDMHESIAGIVAGRIKDKLFKPVIIITKGEKFAKGSGRSIENYNLFDELYKCRHLFERFGGHAMAAGLSIKEEKIDIFKNLINDNCNLEEKDFEEIIRLDKEICLSDITFELAMELNLLQPVGKGNKEAVFGTKNVVPERIKVMEDKNTIIFEFIIENTNRSIKGICFGKIDDFKANLCKIYSNYEFEKIMNGFLSNIDINMDILYKIRINEYKSNLSVQINLIDFKINKGNVK